MPRSAAANAEARAKTQAALEYPQGATGTTATQNLRRYLDKFLEILASPAASAATKAA